MLYTRPTVFGRVQPLTITPTLTLTLPTVFGRVQPLTITLTLTPTPKLNHNPSLNPK